MSLLAVVSPPERRHWRWTGWIINLHCQEAMLKQRQFQVLIPVARTRATPCKFTSRGFLVGARAGSAARTAGLRIPRTEHNANYSPVLDRCGYRVRLLSTGFPRGDILAHQQPRCGIPNAPIWCYLDQYPFPHLFQLIFQRVPAAWVASIAGVYPMACGFPSCPPLLNVTLPV